MIAGLLITLREGLEAALIVGLVFGVLKKTKSLGLGSSVWAGVGAASLLSLGFAVFLQWVGASLEGEAEAAFEGVMMLLAAGVLTWMILWLQRQGNKAQAGLEQDVRQAAGRGQRMGLFGIAFFAVLREGVETALFLTAAAVSSGALGTFTGGLVGLAAAILIGWGLYASTIRLDVRRFFLITSALLVLFAAGLVGHGIHELNEAGWIPSVIDPVWDVSSVMSDEVGVGLGLKTVFGYNANPSLTEVLGYLAYFALVVIGIRRAQVKPEFAPQQA
jgi:high-affinity iron transporter